MSNVLLSSKTDLWGTPQELFDALDYVFNFTLDPCATSENAKCRRFFTKKENGLEQDWGEHRVWMNPPYGRQLPLWMKKAYEASLGGALVVCLVPARTETDWWFDYALKGTVRYFHGRLAFDGATKSGKPESATFPSALVIFWPAAVEQYFIQR